MNDELQLKELTYWDYVRAYIVSHTTHCRTSRWLLMYHHLVEDEQWELRLHQLAPPNAEQSFSARDCAREIIFNYYR